jgi:hypothetical protein
MFSFFQVNAISVIASSPIGSTYFLSRLYHALRRHACGLSGRLRALF